LGPNPTTTSSPDSPETIDQHTTDQHYELDGFRFQSPLLKKKTN